MAGKATKRKLAEYAADSPDDEEEEDILEEDDEGDEGDEEGEEDEEFEIDYTPVVLKDKRKPSELADFQKLLADNDSRAFMQWLIAPMDLDEFCENIFENRPMVIKRPKHPEYYKGVLSKDDIDTCLRTNDMQYKYNLDVTHYDMVKGRSNYNYNSDEEPPADAPGPAPAVDVDVVWRRYHEQGCSLRLLHPQRWVDPLWKFLVHLERFWGSGTGSNAYLTPPNSQGFSPHYDDIDAFILQTEGRKLWRCYAPRCREEALPRFSSRNFEQGEIGAPVLEVELCAGDLLYMPRGCIHQARCTADHSLHVTVSTNHLNTWGDLLAAAVPQALEAALAEDPEMRRTLPRDLYSCMGLMHSDRQDERRELIQQQATGLVMRLLEGGLPVDEAADQLATRFLRNRLPLPQLLSRDYQHKPASEPVQLTIQSKVRLVEAGVARLMGASEEHEDVVEVLHILENPRKQHMQGEATVSDEEEEGQDQEAQGHDDRDGEALRTNGGSADDAPGVMQFPIEQAPAIEVLLHAHPKEVAIAALPLDSKKDSLEVAQRLYDKGILVLA